MTTIEQCEKCHGIGEVPSGHLGPWGPVSRVCPVCDGLGAVEVEPEPEPLPPAPAGFDRRSHCQQIGTLGGQKTAQTYGSAYMREIGRIGFQAYADRHHGGNRAAALGSLRKLTHPDARVRQPGPYRQVALVPAGD